MNRIARVFPRKTAASPTDALAFFREPTADDFASCIEADVSAVHISVTFTWDIPRVEDLYYAWQILGVPVMVGGPAFDDRMGDFAPGLYLKDGYIFTSRGCTKECWFCSVPRCAHGEIRELPVVDGWNILDDNILGTRIFCARSSRSASTQPTTRKMIWSRWSKWARSCAARDSAREVIPCAAMCLSGTTGTASRTRKSA